MRKFTLVLLALFQACTATETGNPSDSRIDLGDVETSGENNGCENSKSELTDSDAITSVGLSTQALLNMVTGEHHETLAWLGNPSSYSPESGMSGIVLTVEPLGRVWLVEREPAQPAPGEQRGNLDLVVPDLDCPDLLEVEVSLRILTDGGALDETVDVTLHASSPDYASLGVELPTDSLIGTFQANEVVPEGFELTRAPTLVLNADIFSDGSVGEFGLFRKYDNGAIGQGSNGILARFSAKAVE